MSRAYKVLDEKVLRSETFECSKALKSDAKFKEKLTPGSKNDKRNLVNFNVSSEKSEKLETKKYR